MSNFQKKRLENIAERKLSKKEKSKAVGQNVVYGKNTNRFLLTALWGQRCIQH